MLNRNVASIMGESETKPTVSGCKRNRAATYAPPQQRMANHIPRETKSGCFPCVSCACCLTVLLMAVVYDIGENMILFGILFLTTLASTAASPVSVKNPPGVKHNYPAL